MEQSRLDPKVSSVPHKATISSFRNCTGFCFVLHSFCRDLKISAGPSLVYPVEKQSIFFPIIWYVPHISVCYEQLVLGKQIMVVVTVHHVCTNPAFHTLFTNYLPFTSCVGMPMLVWPLHCYLNTTFSRFETIPTYIFPPLPSALYSISSVIPLHIKSLCKGPLS